MSTIVASIVAALVIGFGGGYFLRSDAVPATGSHLMPDGSSMANAMAGMAAGLEGKTGDVFDKAFIEEMIVHHEGAVLMAEQALKNAKHSEIKDMAQVIIDAQTGEIATMREWLKSWYGIQFQY
jgi:uncharacterized protein (DUF305 family)